MQKVVTLVTFSPKRRRNNVYATSKVVTKVVTMVVTVTTKMVTPTLWEGRTRSPHWNK